MRIASLETGGAHRQPDYRHWDVAPNLRLHNEYQGGIVYKFDKRAHFVRAQSSTMQPIEHAQRLKRSPTKMTCRRAAKKGVYEFRA